MRKACINCGCETGSSLIADSYCSYECSVAFNDEEDKEFISNK